MGVHAIQSTAQPEDFHADQTFDFIYVGSLFTHLPDHLFRRWLNRLYELLTPNGILAFTTHGPGHLKAGVTMPAEGIYYIPETEIPSLDPEVYGATIVTPEYVKKLFRTLLKALIFDIRSARSHSGKTCGSYLGSRCQLRLFCTIRDHRGT
jgi:SAM-dependent methyltransferase